nr:zinc finger, CCHC-type [Tanacetum cinerariifolium]
IDYFDTYALVARISTIRLLIAVTSVHYLIIHQMDVKTAFLNGKIEDEVFMNQPQGFIMPGNENKVDLTKEFLSSKFSMKDIGEANVILGIRIKHERNGIAISQSYYIEKVLKKFNYFNHNLVSTPMDTIEKLMPNNGQAVSQLEYFRMIGCLMYAMTCTRPGIAFFMGKLSMYTSNPSTQHWQVIQWVLKYLKKTMDYRLMYAGYPLVLEGYTNASWISNTKDNSSTSGWVFLEPEWLKNLLLEIPSWSKPITHISICCDSAATLAKAYSQFYNAKFRHLGVRHSMIHELITNGLVSIEFVRVQFIPDNRAEGTECTPIGCKPLGCKWIFKRKLKVDGTVEKFNARLVIEGFKQKSGIDYFDTYALVARISTIRLLIAVTSVHYLIIHQMDVKTAFLNGEMEDEVFMNQPQGFIMPGNENKVCKLIKSLYGLKQAPKKWHQNLMNWFCLMVIYLTKLKKYVHSKFDKSVSTPMDTSEKLMPNNGQAVSQLEYFRMIGCLMYAMTCTRPGIAFFMGKLSMYTSNPSTRTGKQFNGNTKDNSSTSGWVFLEPEWLKNLLLEIPSWFKPITPISICCDSAATLAKAYSQFYNAKSRHLGVRHSMIHELITNGLVSIEFVRSQQNLADHLKKGLARDLVIKSAEGMGLNSN